jgi:hypothetical protein
MATKFASPNAMWCFLIARHLGLCICTHLLQDTPELRMNHTCHFKNQSWHAAVGKGGNGLSPGCLPCHKGQTPRTLKRYAEKTMRVSLFVCRSLVTIISSIHHTDFMKCIRELWITLYWEICTFSVVWILTTKKYSTGKTINGEMFCGVHQYFRNASFKSPLFG